MCTFVISFCVGSFINKAVNNQHLLFFQQVFLINFDDGSQNEINLVLQITDLGQQTAIPAITVFPLLLEDQHLGVLQDVFPDLQPWDGLLIPLWLHPDSLLQRIAAVDSLIGEESCSFQWETLVEQQDPCTARHFREETFATGKFFDPEAAGKRGEGGEELGPTREEVVGIVEEDALPVGYQVNLRLERQNLRLVPDDRDVGNGQTVQEVHQDDHYEEDESNEEDGADWVAAEGNVTELQFPHKHSEGLGKTEKI